MSEVWYTAVEQYGPHTKDGVSWNNYIQLPKLFQLKEVVSLDSMLCPSLLRNDEDIDWSKVVSEDRMLNMFTDLEYLRSKVKEHNEYNILAVVKEPDNTDRGEQLKGFEFIGYDLVDRDMIASALTNCGGFNETFKPDELNQYGLLDSRKNAYDVRARLAINNPSEDHADCWVFEIWRMKE